MSHIETTIFRNLANRSALLITLLFISPCHAKLQCEKLFKPSFTETIRAGLNYLNPLRGLSKNKISVITSDEAIEIAEFFKSDLNMRPYGMAQNQSEPLMMYIWNLIPEGKKSALVSLIQNSDQSFTKFHSSMSNALSAHQIELGVGSTFFSALVRNWTDSIRFSSEPMSFENWIAEALQSYNKRLHNGDLNLQELKFRYDQGLVFNRASEHWKNSFGVHILQTRESNGETQIFINGQWLKTKINKSENSILILAARTMVKRAAWNPIYSKVLQQKIESGQRPLAKYPSFIGTDGFFYLSDGNHRFTIDNRPEVWLEMSYPARTSSMSNTFDAIGIPQPSIENLAKLLANEITLESLIGETFAAKIIFR